jgi:hypothetical protein
MIENTQAEQTAGISTTTTTTYKPYIPVKNVVCALYVEQTSALGNHNSCMVQENDCLHNNWKLISTELNTSHGKPVWLLELPSQVENFSRECWELEGTYEALLDELKEDAEDDYPIKVEQDDNDIIITYYEGKNKTKHYPFDEYIGTVRAVFSYHTEYMEVN